MTVIGEDLVYLAARIHARRSRIADAQRLEALCRLQSLQELGRAVLPEREAASVPGFQRRLVLGWLEEMEELASGLSPRRARMIEAFSSRLRVEDLKLLVRGLATHLPRKSLHNRFLRPIADKALASVATLEDLAALLAARPSAEGPGSREDPSDVGVPSPSPFALETFLDRGYFQGLLAAMEGLEPSDRGRIRALVQQEVDHFHLMLVVRGRFLRGLGAQALLPWHVPGTGITRSIFAAMLSDSDLPRAVGRADGIALDDLPPPERLEANVLEAHAWSRFLRLAHRTFLDGGMEFAVVVGYAALRRVEVANLITLSEGIRLGVPANAIRGRMVSRSGPEAALA
jgi:vacuolar-type H+-ATPase subunit C/Vma6